MSCLPKSGRNPSASSLLLTWSVRSIKKEARQLLKHIEHKKRTWFRRVMTIAASVAAVIAIVTGSISYFRYMSEQQITFAEISTSFWREETGGITGRNYISVELLFTSTLS